MRKIDRIVGSALRAIPIACLAALFGLLFVNVLARTLRFSGFAWFDEIVQGLFAWMVFVGAAALWREGDHFQVTWLPESLPSAPARVLRIATTVLAIVFLLAMTWYGAALTLGAKALTPILDLPTALFYAAIPLSGVFMLIHSLADLFRLVTKKESDA